MYICTKRFRATALDGAVNIPYGTEVSVSGGILMHGDKRLCYLSSQNAKDYFTSNDDGCGLERRQRIDGIVDTLRAATERADAAHAALLQDLAEDEQPPQRVNAPEWERVWADPICNKYKRPDYEDYWLWSAEFYAAPMEDLRYIKNLVEGEDNNDHTGSD